MKVEDFWHREEKHWIGRMQRVERFIREYYLMSKSPNIASSNLVLYDLVDGAFGGTKS